MFSSGWPNVRRTGTSLRFPSPTTWHPWQPMPLTIFSPLAASPRGGFFTANSCVSEFAKRYAATALISTSFRTASSGELEFELYQMRGIHVAGFTARGLRIHVLTQSGVSFASIFVRIGPGFLTFSNPFVVWHAKQPARSYVAYARFRLSAFGMNTCCL